jgi:2-polyprenyl-3-methyl-5-hydroxy-6-metoxy-1,4-benzoquinol methylase
MTDTDDIIRTEPQPTCQVCGSGGSPRYDGLTDRLFGASGTWNIKACANAACGALWLDPRPTLADVGKAYRNYYTHGTTGVARLVQQTVRTLARAHSVARYGFPANGLPRPAARAAALLASLYPGLAAHLDLLVRYLPHSAMGGGRLLDVGCGDGQALEILADLGWQVSGVEVDANAVAVARGRGLDVHNGTLDDTGLADETFDAVTSSHVIEHVHDCAAFLAQSRRVLKPGGRLVAVTPNARAMLLDRHGSNWLALDPPRHLFLFTVESLRALAQRVGLRDVQVITTSRAVALNHIASTKIAEGHYDWGRWPGTPTWLKAQALQCWEPVAMKLGKAEGEELVLIASR